ncbi:alpha-1,3/1,6-mannosyltransferase Alg2 [Brevipalpus obovatus]|uniref:alpha-1,3/1,6-mannosyltransferase Alg2 n=1 Tax=Brevipalpus obovatus TaxID=246614 RepID=UPI003D9F9A0A
MKILCIHPDLGIGGAERLMIDVGLSLKRIGQDVKFVTSYHDPKRCFPETIDGSLEVKVSANWFPRSICGHFYALCAYLRMIILAFSVVIQSKICDSNSFDLVICDLVSAQIPFLKWLYKFIHGKPLRVIFYCHHPDQLLTQKHSLIRSVYRFPLNWLEEVTTGMADRILVNSDYTASVFRSTFHSLTKVDIKVLYPICNFGSLDMPVKDKLSDTKIPSDNSTVFLSINRYERKKGLSLCIEAFAVVKKQLKSRDEEIPYCHLIVAGGYDDRLRENVEYYQELVNLAAKLGVDKEVTFLKSPSDERKRALIHRCTALVYTPQDEHFGIVPLEAMFLQTPVIACNSGGPLETVKDGLTGFLCDPMAESFARAMLKFVDDRGLSRKMGKKGRRHVLKEFSSRTFDEHLLAVIQEQ